MQYEGYPENWDRVRNYIYSRDNYQCQRCGRRVPEVTIHCHHIKPLGIGGNNHPSNLLVLCIQCHKEVHEFKLYDEINHIAREKGIK